LLLWHIVIFFYLLASISISPEVELYLQPINLVTPLLRCNAYHNHLVVYAFHLGRDGTRGGEIIWTRDGTRKIHFRVKYHHKLK